MAGKSPTSTEVLGLVQAQQATIDDLSKRLTGAEEKVKIQEAKNTRQESTNRNVLIGVSIAALLIVVTVAAEVLISNKHDDDFYTNAYDKVMKDQDQLSELEKQIKATNATFESQIQLLKARNPYLK